MRLRLIGAAAVVTLLTACGSGDGSGTRPSVSVTLPAGVTTPPGGDTTPPEPAPPETAPPEAPETAPPETAPPETAPPETAPPETAAPDTAAPDTAPPDTLAPESDDDATVWWPWVLGGLVLVGLVAWLMTRSKSRSAAPWQVRTTTVLDDVDQLSSHLPGLTPDGLVAVAPSDARMLAALRATVQDLMATAPDASAQASVSKLVAPLADLHGALDAIALGGQTVLPGGMTAAQLATQLHTASASVRADLALRR